jgi:hypothetical protein
MITDYVRDGITIGSDWMIADLKRDEAEGVARRALTIVAPELWPAIVIFDEDPPIIGMPAFKTFKALITSPTAKFVPPLGAMKPNYTQVSKGLGMMMDGTVPRQVCTGQRQQCFESQRQG